MSFHHGWRETRLASPAPEIPSHQDAIVNLRPRPPSRLYSSPSGDPNPPMPVLAAIDIGSNSSRLKIARVVEHRLKQLHEDREVTRLGTSVFETGLISPDAMANSRCLMIPRPLTWPSIATLNGGSVNTMAACRSSIRSRYDEASRALPHRIR